MSLATIFLHIPRTGGTTLGVAAYRHHGQSEILVLHPAREVPRILRSLTDEQRARFRFIRGHVPYGIHASFPQECRYVTILRDPVERVISVYEFIRSSPEHPLHRLVAEEGVDLPGFVERGLSPGQMDGQTRLLSGMKPWDPDWTRNLDAGTLDRARRNLETFAVVGLTERFDESMSAIHHALGWPLLPYGRLNESRERPRREDIPLSLLRRIEALNELDRELYEHARSLFDSRPKLRTVDRPAASARSEEPEPSSLGAGARVRHVVKQVLPFGLVRWIQRRRAEDATPPEPAPEDQAEEEAPAFRAAPAVMRHLARMRDQGFAPNVVVDVGAAHGLWTRDCMQIFQDAECVLLEPLPDYAEALSALALDPRVTYVAAAAGREASRLPMYVPDLLEGASLVPSSGGLEFFKRSLEVPVVRLDDLPIPDGSLLLKLDVQGYELEVLAGAERLMRRTDVIVAECSLFPFQEGLPLVTDVIDTLKGAGFAIYDLGDETRFSSGVLGQVDIMFVREESPLRDRRFWTLEGT